MYVCMCNPLCTCMYNIQKYKTQISTYAIFVRSHFLVQAIYHNKIHCIIQTQKSEKGTETTSHTPEKQQRKPKKLYKHGKIQNHILYIFQIQIQPIPMKEILCMVQLLYMCLYMKLFSYYLGFPGLYNCCYIPCVGWNFPVKYTPEFLKN